MSAIMAKVEKEIIARSEQCERGIVGDRTMDGVPIAAYVRVAPNCILYVQPLNPFDDDADLFLEFCLN